MQRDARQRSPARPVVGDSDNVRSLIKRTEDYIEESKSQMRDYKKEIDLLRQEISLMENHLSTQNDENVKVLNPFIMANFQDLSNQITGQRKENDHMQKQLVELKKEKSLIQQMIIQSQHKIAELEEAVGV